MVQHHWDERGFELFKMVLTAIIQTEKGMPLSEQVSLAKEATSCLLYTSQENVALQQDNTHKTKVIETLVKDISLAEDVYKRQTL